MTIQEESHQPSREGRPIRARPVRHPSRWVASSVLFILGVMLVHTLIVNSRFQWDVVAQYFTSEAILTGLSRTLQLTLIAMTIGIVMGVVLAVMRLSSSPILVGTSSTFVWFFRGTPLLVQLIFWFNLSALYPRLSLGVPFGPEFVSGNVNGFLTAWVAAILGLALNESAYMAEIVRAGILSVDEGQTEAASALGMRRIQTLRRVILPQAMRVIVPPTGNQLISMLKTTSLVSVIALPELLYSAQIIYSRTFQPIPLLLTASLWYLIVTSILMLGQRYLEMHYGRGIRSRDQSHATQLRVLQLLRRGSAKA